MSRLRRAVELLNSDNEVVYARSVGTVFPFTVVSDTVNFLVESDRAAVGNIGLGPVSQILDCREYRKPPKKLIAFCHA